MLEAETADELLRLAHADLARELRILSCVRRSPLKRSPKWKSAARLCPASADGPFKRNSAKERAVKQAEAELLRERLAKAELPEEV